MVARLLAQGLAASLSQSVIVDNRGSAGGIVAAQLLARAMPDGHTLLFYSSSIWTLPLLQGTGSYDVARDFAPITSATSSPNVIVVRPSLSVSTVKDLIALAKANPGELNYASGNSGSANHLAAELFKASAQVRIERVPYKGTGPALNGVLGGEVQLMFPAVGSASPHLKTGKLRALAVTSLKPSALAPGLPTVAATLPGYEAVAMSGVFAPGKTPSVLIDRLNQEFVRLLDRSELRDKLLATGLEPNGGSPQALITTIRSEVSRLARLVKETGIRSE